MTTDKSIFGLRFQSNEKVQPSQEELKVFLLSRKKATGPELHSDDLAHYNELLKGVDAFQHHQLPDAARGFRDKLLYGLLHASQFVKPALKSAVEQYKFHFHAYQALDFIKPSAFIRSAEEEMKKLNPNKKKADADKLLRLKGMVDERKAALAVLTLRRTALVEELCHLAQYVRDNLSKIEHLCEASIVVLVELQINHKKEEQLVEDIKTQFKERLRDSLHQGQINRQDLETAKTEVALLGKEIADLLRGDVYSLTGLYEAIHEHAKKIAQKIATLMGRIENTKNDMRDDECKLFEQIEQALVSLVSDCRFELKLANICTETSHEDILLEKRKEMLDYLLELLEKRPS